ncbi:MAG: hypothetical protein ACOX9E_11050 [Lentisphaeria bacterium]|jgi:hypothetical protein
METILRVCYVARLQRAVSDGDFPGVAPQAQPQADMWCPFRALICFAPSALKTKEAIEKRKHTGFPTPSSLLSKKICANLRNLRIKNVCYQRLAVYGEIVKITLRIMTNIALALDSWIILKLHLDIQEA